jgi:cation:H+ antiporter
MTVLLLLASFVLIVGGALLFTNAVEWLGARLGLGESAVGSLLAAVGTALPESLIPVVALLAGAENQDVAIGAIVGAPFMLGTIAMLLVGISALGFRKRRTHGNEVTVDLKTVRRDLGLFLVFFPLGIGLGLIPVKGLHYAAAAVFVIAYGVFVWITIRGGGETTEQHSLRPLQFDTTKEDPPSNLQIGAQTLVSLGMIIFGAELFVEEVTVVAESLGIEELVLALVLAPLATELPEKANSFIWIRQSKDDLAIGNITGAMAFQSTVPMALGFLFTTWELDEAAVAAAVLGVAGGLLALWRLHRKTFRLPFVLAWGILFSAYVVFVALIA